MMKNPKRFSNANFSLNLQNKPPNHLNALKEAAKEVKLKRKMIK